MNSEAPVFKIKTGHLPVLLLHVLTTDLELLKAQLALRLRQTPDFFASTPIVLELTAIADSAGAPDFSGLVAFMREHGMCASGVTGGSEDQRAAAVKSGLGLYPDAQIRIAMRRSTDGQGDASGEHRAAVATTATSPPEAAVLQVQPELPGLSGESASVAPVQPEISRDAAHPAAQERAVVRPTLVIDKPVRTGQSIYAEGANLVLLAIANAGSELIADGDIHVYAPLRGKAIAGAHGNQSARIFVNRLEAELLSIAGCFKVFEDGLPEAVRGKPAQIHLEGNRLVMQPLLD
ncbi:MAG: septum site-determining protein MinC [Gallionella sp.]|nr:septum site-determining protein MinC [Gallionella sp.]MDD4945724.1 septum site-determining protein MinC [Gallionella sp.]MDD5613255.1 septum site-determining protein MinC [Gallionella sp.]